MGAGTSILRDKVKPLALEKLKREKEILDQLKRTSDALISDLSGNGGAVVKQIIAKLIERVNTLVAEDKECSLLMNVLETIDLKVSYLGAKVINSRLEKIISLLGSDS